MTQKESPNMAADLSIDGPRERSWSGSARKPSESDNSKRATKGFRGLVVWQRAVEMALAIYALTTEFPAGERFGLSSQMRRAAISVPSNIAEGYGRSTTGEFKQFLGNARGSNCELETQLVIAKKLGFGSPQALAKAETLIADVSRLLRAYTRALGKGGD